MNSDELRAALLAGDLSRPRLTWYDDGRTERIDLSGKTLANWVAKAANWLESEMALTPGDLVRLDLPADHWRAIYWTLAAWTRGLTVTASTDADACVSLDAGADPSADLVEPAAALAASPLQAMPDVMPAPVGSVDEDQEAVAGTDPATYADLSTTVGQPGGRVLLADVPTHRVPVVVAGLIGRGCSVVVLRDADEQTRADRSASEAVDLVL
ncbi:TIGR03089 family protein [Flexivirga lutea]